MSKKESEELIKVNDCAQNIIRGFDNRNQINIKIANLDTVLKSQTSSKRNKNSSGVVKTVFSKR